MNKPWLRYLKALFQKAKLPIPSGAELASRKEQLCRSLNVNPEGEQPEPEQVLALTDGECAQLIKETMNTPGMNVNSILNADSHTALFRTAMDGKTDSVDTLLTIPGIDKNHASQGGNTPLLIALINENNDVAKKLLAAGADPDQPNNQGVTPLLKSIEKNNVEMVRLLVGKHKARVTQELVTVAEQKPEIDKKIINLLKWNAPRISAEP